jgi:glucokinase
MLNVAGAVNARNWCGRYNIRMILAADVGGSKTLVGLFEVMRPRPRLVDAEAVRTLDFESLPALLDRYLSRHRGVTLDRVGLGVAGPILHGEATLTNVPWRVRGNEVSVLTGVADVRLLNDLEAMAYAVPWLTAGELHTLRPGRPAPNGNAALIAAGTGLGEAVLHRVGGRMLPVPSEAGHADFAVRTDDELGLFALLRARFGRVEIEHVICGPGLVRLAEFAHAGPRCEVIGNFENDADGAARVSASGVEGRCECCRRAVTMFVDAYGAEAGNLALTVLATGGIYLAGGIAPRLIGVLREGTFMEAFRRKGELEPFLARVPVMVIMNPDAGLLGAGAAAIAIEPERAARPAP